MKPSKPERFRFVASGLILLLWASSAQSQLDSGLEMKDYKRIEVLIEEINEDAKQPGLSEELFRAKVELRLRQNGLIPISDHKDGYLYVRINTIRNAYRIDVHFKRAVFYHSDGKTYSTFAATWDRGSTGTFGGDSDYILQQLTNYVDLFINAYLSANEK